MCIFSACGGFIFGHCLCSSNAGPDLRDVQDVRGRTALHISAERRNIDLAKVLLDGGIDQGLTNEAGHTALDIFLENFTTRSDSFWTLVWKTTFHSMETLRGIERKENGNGEDSASSPGKCHHHMYTTKPTY